MSWPKFSNSLVAFICVLPATSMSTKNAEEIGKFAAQGKMQQYNDLRESQLYEMSGNMQVLY